MDHRKTKSLRFRDPESSVSATAKWSDLVDLYKKLSESGINMTKLNYQTLYPDRFEKQKVMLVVNIFNEKTVAALIHNEFNDTAVFVPQVSRMWNILNIKSPKATVRLNDPDWQTFTDKNNAPLQFLLSMANSFSEINSRSIPDGMRKQMLSIDTSEGLFNSKGNGVLNSGFVRERISLCTSSKCRVTVLRANLVYIVQLLVEITISRPTKWLASAMVEIVQMIAVRSIKRAQTRYLLYGGVHRI